MTGFGFIVSDRFKKVLSSCKLPDHEFYPAKILHNKIWLEDYYWLRIAASMMVDLVDYKKSDFYVKNLAKFFSDDLASIEVISKEDFDLKENELRNKDSNLCIWAKSLTMNAHFDTHWDIFSMTKFNADTFISERLKKAIDENGLTGLSMKSTEIIKLIIALQ